MTVDLVAEDAGQDVVEFAVAQSAVGYVAAATARRRRRWTMDIGVSDLEKRSPTKFFNNTSSAGCGGGLKFECGGAWL